MWKALSCDDAVGVVMSHAKEKSEELAPEYYKTLSQSILIKGR